MGSGEPNGSPKGAQKGSRFISKWYGAHESRLKFSGRKSTFLNISGIPGGAKREPNGRPKGGQMGAQKGPKRDPVLSPSGTVRTSRV